MDPDPEHLPLLLVTQGEQALYLVIYLLLLICSALISGAEVAFFSLTSSELEEPNEAFTKQNVVSKLLERPKKLLATILIANNAMDLSLLITDNMGLDTSAQAMKMYARAEFLAFQKKWEASIKTLDSLLINFSGHSLSDEVIYKKGEISMQIKSYNEAIIYFQEVAENYGYDILADDALFQWAKLTEEHLKDNEKALMLYEQILLKHNGSIYASEARNRFRILRGAKENIAQ